MKPRESFFKVRAVQQGVAGPPDETSGHALSRIGKTVNALLDGGRCGPALRLAAEAANRFPGSPVLAKLLEKALSCGAAGSGAGRLYAGILGRPGACPGHFYYLGMFRKRAGDYAGMKKAFAGFLSSGGRREPVHEYIACCTLDKYEEAFIAAERILDSPGCDAVLSRLWNPWGDRSSSSPRGFFAGRLAGLDAAVISPEREHYRTFFRAILLFYSGAGPAALREFDRMAPLPPARYGWMRFPAGWAGLYGCDYVRALSEFSVSAKCVVSRPPSLGRIAEIYICRGKTAAGFREFRKALKTAPLWAAAGLHSWEGQMRLFTGDYKRAIKSLTTGAELGDDAAFCWRGAAYARLGFLEEALADLDKAVKLFPTDKEARVWRGEALRLAGRPAEALADLEAALASGPHDWAYINRALARGSLGDIKGMKEDFLRVDPEIRAFLEQRSRAAGIRAPDGAGLRGLLEEACRLALGNRRDDKYFNPVWMRRARRRFTKKGGGKGRGLM